MNGAQLIAHLRAEDARLKQRVRGLERTQDPTWIRRRSQRDGLEQACLRLVLVQRQRTGDTPYDQGWRDACDEAQGRISDEITELMELLYGKPEQLALTDGGAS